MTGRSSRILGIVATLLSFFPALAAADGLRFTRVPSGSVRPGDVVELAWSRPAGRVEELEIVLSLDGGQRYTVRVSPELDRAIDHYTWKVPHLLAAHARLCVRLGDERGERLSAPSAEFAILATPDPGPAPQVRSAYVTHPGATLDWWDEADAAPRAGDAPAMCAVPALARGTADATAAAASRRAPNAAVAATVVCCVPLDLSGTSAVLAAAPVAPAPRFVPQRE